MLEQPTLRNLTNGNFGVPPEIQNSLLQGLGAPHVSSFNYMLKEGLQKAIADLNPVEFEVGSDVLKFQVNYATIDNPMVPPGTVLVKDPKIFPTECRQRAATYKGKLSVEVRWFVNGKEQQSFIKDLGEVPIMLRSNKCNLNEMSPSELVKHGEHEQEWGGYFIIKGHERLVRMLVMTRRNFPICLKRSSWKTRGSLFSDMGVSIRCVKEDQTSTNNVLHYVTDGSVKFMFSSNKNLYYVPMLLIAKALGNYVDHYIYKKLMQGYEEDFYYSDCIQNMLRALHVEGLHTPKACKEYIGKMFRVKFPECPKSFTNKQVANYILKHCILIHLDKDEDKFNMLVFMTQKLFMFVQEKCRAEGADTTMMHELLLGGHLYLKVLKEKIQGWLIGVRMAVLKRSETSKFSITQSDILNATKFAGSIEGSMENFLATGNIRSPSGLGLMQDKGLTIVAENINRMRFMSHFKAVHRGSFFQEMRTTEPRQLLPDAWGFICPVHTPDGAPCGLLNHLSLNCIVTDIPDPKAVKNIPLVLASLGMDSITSMMVDQTVKDHYVVQLDGAIIGYLYKPFAPDLVRQLRIYKAEGVKVPYMLEIVMVPFKESAAQFPGLFLFTGPARMMRPLYNLQAGKIEFVGTFEQVYMDICVVPSERYEGVTTHMEITKTSFMSNLAHLIPMPDCNQSPRNMYQCQMGKQTMGTPCHNWSLQAETKLYRLQTPGSPLFRPVHHDNINMDDFAMGTNAIVAVISYTGYDMEDAIIINKASQERGFAHGSIYKSEFVELDDPQSYFCRDPQNSTLAAYLDTDGLPYIGRLVKYDEPLCCYYSEESNRYAVKKFNGKEECYVNNVKLCGNFGKGNRLACISFRVLRNHFVGDKFASRAGQKGICSQTWPVEDLPFTETGLVPDIIFNPHGFPSRMTIAMMIEIMAGKSAALHGFVHDASPFRFTEDNTAINYFGKLLEAAGYDYYGRERMYSGIDGREMSVEIFFGVVHYQRLRHMVSDKWQVRSTGPIDALTRQPVKGRKRGGGVRFGEMERDALLSHGTSFLLQDRLFHCSDKTKVLICTACGSLLGPYISVTKVADKPQLSDATRMCKLCGKGDNVNDIEVPYIFKFFVTQLASCNINLKLTCKDV